MACSNRVIATAALSLGVAALGPGCEKGPSDEDYDDVAGSVGAMLSAEEDAADYGHKLATGTTPTGMTASAEGSYTGAFGGLTYAIELSCEDEANTVLAACGPTADEAILTVDFHGAWAGPRYEIEVDRGGEWTLSNLQDEVATLDGVGTFDVSSTFVALLSDRQRTFELDYDARYEAVQIDRAQARLVGGHIEYDVAMHRTASGGGRDAEASFVIRADIDVLGPGVARLTLDGERRYEVSLESGTVTPSE